MGTVAVFDPTEVSGLDETSSWTPLLGCRTWAGARRIARSLTDGAGGKRSLADGEFWFSAAAKLLAPLLFAAATSGLTMDTVVEWIDTQEETDVFNALEAANDPGALNAHRATWSRDERQRSSIYTTAETVLEAYADPGVLEHSRVPDIESRWLLNGGAHTLYLCESGREQRRLRPVFVALLEEMIEAAYVESGIRGAPLDPPLLIVLDEVANTAPLPDLDALVSTAASHGIQLITILQDLAQARPLGPRARGDDREQPTEESCSGSGLADERALSWISRLLGDTELTQVSHTYSDRARRTTTRSQTFRPLVPHNSLRQKPGGSALLVYGTLPPAHIQVRPCLNSGNLVRVVRTVDRRGHAIIGTRLLADDNARDAETHRGYATRTHAVETHPSPRHVPRIGDGCRPLADLLSRAGSSVGTHDRDVHCGGGFVSTRAQTP